MYQYENRRSMSKCKRLLALLMVMFLLAPLMHSEWSVSAAGQATTIILTNGTNPGDGSEKISGADIVAREQADPNVMDGGAGQAVSELRFTEKEDEPGTYQADLDDAKTWEISILHKDYQSKILEDTEWTSGSSSTVTLTEKTGQTLKFADNTPTRITTTDGVTIQAVSEYPGTDAQIVYSVENKREEPDIQTGQPDQTGQEGETETPIAVIDPASGELTINKAGEITVTAVKSGDDTFKEASVSQDITIEKTKVYDFAFEGIMTQPLQLTIGDTQTHKAASVNWGDKAKVTYQSDDPEYVSVNSETGEITALKETTDPVTITASLASDIYEADPVTYTVTVQKKQQTALVFKNPNPAAIPADTQGYANTIATQGTEVDNAVSYSIEDAAQREIASVDPDSGVLTIHKAGTVTVTATKQGNEEYADVTAQYTIEFEKVKLTDFHFQTFQETLVELMLGNDYNNTAVSEKAGDKITVQYQSSGTESVSVDSAGNITLNKFAENLVTITASLISDIYEADPISYQIQIKKKQQTALAFENPNPAAIPADTQDYANTIATQGTEVDNAVSYSIEDAAQREIASVDPDSGVLTIHKAGTVTVTATKQGNEEYADVTAQYTIEIQLADRAPLMFTEAEGKNPKKVYLGSHNTYVAAPVGLDGTEDGAAITYWIVRTSGNVGRTNIIAQTGELYAAGNGTVTIRASKPETDKYKEVFTDYTIEITYLDTQGTTAYSLEGTKIKDWYSSDVNIVAKEGYVICSALSEDPDSSSWLSSMTINNEGVNKVKFYARRESDGAVSQETATIKIDKTSPKGTVKLQSGLKTEWNKLATALFYSIYGRDTIFLTADCLDVNSNASAGSGVASVRYYIAPDDRARTEAELQALGPEVWKELTTLSLNPNQHSVVYIQIMDAVGHTVYISTNRLILDNQKPAVELGLPEVESGIYTENVPVEVKVAEPVADGTYAGVQSVEYQVLSQGQVTQSGTLYSKHTDTLQAVQTWNGLLVVDAGLNNSNEVEVRVTATDMAGNTITETRQLKIDMTDPVMTVSYDNNDGDASFGDGVYFNRSRTATIRIRERNFDENRVSVQITNTHGQMPAVSAWSKTEGSGNGDDTVYTATISYQAEGDYTFAISCEDAAGRWAQSANYGNALAPTAFTIDTIAPTISVAYDNNQVMNGNYYKEARQATVTIVEHNFEPGRVQFRATAANGGAAAAQPGITGWSSNGDIHQATISFASDALYQWNISYTDKAGNQAASMPEESFYVDTTAPSVTVSGITDHSANNQDRIGFTVESTDTNFDTFDVELTVLVRDGNGFTTKKIDGTISETGNGQRYSVNNLEEDGIYFLKCSAADRAGNLMDQVTRIDAAGNAQTLEMSAEDTLLTFSVNREGSTFLMDDTSMELLNHYYIQYVTENITISEINVDPLKEYKVSLNGEVLAEGSDYSVSVSGEDGTWYQYTYSVDKGLFQEEGEYSLVIESVDETDTTAYSDVKNLNAAFVVDQTAPAVTVSGLEKNGRYRVQEQTVTMMPTDEGGKIKSFKVELLDADGKPLENDKGENISVCFDMAGDELTEYLAQHDGKVSFTVPEGLDMQVAVTCEDYAVDAKGNTHTLSAVFDGITVSANAIIIFYANKPLFFGSIGGVTALAAGTAGILVWRKRRARVRKA